MLEDSVEDRAGGFGKISHECAKSPSKSPRKRSVFSLSTVKRE